MEILMLIGLIGGVLVIATTLAVVVIELDRIKKNDGVGK